MREERFLPIGSESTTRGVCDPLRGRRSGSRAKGKTGRSVRSRKIFRDAPTDVRKEKRRQFVCTALTGPANSAALHRGRGSRPCRSDSGLARHGGLAASSDGRLKSAATRVGHGTALRKDEKAAGLKPCLRMGRRTRNRAQARPLQGRGGGNLRIRQGLVLGFGQTRLTGKRGGLCPVVG